MPKIISESELPELLEPGMKVFIQGCTAEPYTLEEALARAPERSAGVEYLGVPLPGYNRFDPAALHPQASMTTFFMTPELRRSPALERIRYVPLHYSDVSRHLRRMPDLDFLLVQCAGEVRAGQCSFGLTEEHASAALAAARRVVVEMNAAIPYTRCQTPLPYDRIDYIVETHRPPPEFPSPDLTEQARAIGAHAASLIRDGDTLQIGIGRLQSAVMRALTGHRALGFHSGLISDETLALIECGAMTGEAKSRDRGVHVAGVVFGSAPLHEFVKDPSVLIAPVSYTHEVPIIATIDNFVSINACMQVDLYGQTMADHINHRQVSAPGGYSDFQRGARMAEGGRSLVLMPAASPDGKRSNVITCLPRGAVLTGVRSDTDYIVTEHGAASLRDLDVQAKAAALIEIAAPQFREQLAREWHELTSAS